MRFADSPPAWSNLSNQESCTTEEWPGEVTYDYVGITSPSGSNIAYDLQLQDWNSSPTGANLISKTEANNSEYDAIEASDNSRWTTVSPGANNEPGIWCDMTIAENENDIDRIDLLFEGYTSGGSAKHLMWVYNYSGSSWEKMGTADTIAGGGTDGVLQRSVTSNIPDYISAGGLLTWMVTSNGNNQSLNVDYVKAGIVIPEEDTTPPASVYLSATGEALCAYVKWLAPGGDDIVGFASTYDIRYSTGGAVNEGNWGSATPVTGEPSPGFPGAWEDMFVTNLSSTTDYYFALKSGDDVPNWADIFNSPGVRPASGDVKAPYSVYDLACGNVTGRSVELSFTAMADDLARWWTGPAYYYDIRYSDSGEVNSSTWAGATQYDDEPRPADPLTTDTVTVTGLSPLTNYWFALKVGDEIIQWSDISNCCNATTDEPWPQQITDLTVAEEWDGVVLSWTAPYQDYNDSGSGSCTEYDIRYGTINITDFNWDAAVQCTGEPTPAASGTTENFVISGLDEGQTYYFAIKACDTVTDNWNDLSNGPSVTIQQPEHDVGDWWMWYVHYNGYGTTGVENKAYLIQNVFAVDETVQTRINNTSSYFNVTGCAHFDWTIDSRNTSNGSWGGARVDITGNPVVPSANSTMFDAEMWTGARDATVRIRFDSIVEYYNLPYSLPDEDIAIETCYTYQGNGSAPASDDGYLFDIGDRMDQYEYKDPDTTLADPLYNDFDWEVMSYTENYNVSAQLNISACDHDGNCSNAIFDVYKLDVTEPGEGDKVQYWYSPEVHNAVRKFDEITYYGMEEYGIVAYEVADFTKQNLDVSAASDPPDEGDTLNVSVEVVNDTGEARKFNLLLLITDLNATTPTDGEPYYNGKTVYPDMSSNPNASWPYYDAIQQTSLLQPGDSEIVYWNSCYTIPSNTPDRQYKVWCSGLTYGPWTAD